MNEALETLITETSNIAREYGHKPRVVRRGRSLRSRPPSAIVVCEQCFVTADLTVFSYKSSCSGILTKVSCIVATDKTNK
jgi:hypothetical protein